jgi:hypothetical protein
VRDVYKGEGVAKDMENFIRSVKPEELINKDGSRK